ncbi:UDP-N-acetylenolpyruvoylglucosamine reductase [Propionigenium maris DSM 9537]|uniref:UDP-N-acetylenolpyruvoylglucosamine reductase n=1 Tax=Propionigenium maris DSM 9537 TaxID=1123000 RepID=A0A9W6LNS4_9FUSO|nr:NAD-dependent epimerase/dehydratase family protein [Propionigenium maris]GLI56913.1 UDP-N-acetylenolpyruvoylglucosamine reductase [Propionigenium maris DSM 9537]
MRKKKTLMITGASGFVGSNFIKKYSEKYNIIPVCLIENKPEELDYSSVDCILHLAALVHQMKGAPEERYFEVNTELTRRIAVEAKKAGVKHFVFYSTVAVWGTHGYFDHDRVITLNTPTNPVTPYAKSKLNAEKILEELSNENFLIYILRPPLVYGEGCPGNIPRLERLIKKLPIVPLGNEENKRSVVHIEKLIDETERIIEKNQSGLYIPKDDKDLSIREIVELLAKQSRKKVVLIKMNFALIKLLHKIRPNIISSLYGSLVFKIANNEVK